MNGDNNNNWETNKLQVQSRSNNNLCVTIQHMIDGVYFYSIITTASEMKT
jgi:hypothetical protein